MDPETAHRLTISALKSGLMPLCPPAPDSRLKQTLWNRSFPNPLGLAAGFDKNADVVGAMFRMGFGFVEAGTVTPKAQAGNPRPRIFRDTVNEAVINRMGFPNEGMQNFRHNIEEFLESRPRPAGVLGINIGMNKGQTDPARDYCALIRLLGGYADYLTVNISSPNTPGLRNLQEKENLLPLLERIQEERNRSCGRTNPPPVLVKLAPDLTDDQIGEIAATVMQAEIDGLILTNTTLDRPDTLPQHMIEESGGLSGRPVCEKSTRVISAFYKETDGKLPIIGAGGISSAQDAYDKICAGASLVQLYTALVFQGPALVGQILSGLVQALEKDGYTHISQAVGTAHSNMSQASSVA